jgi:hypothetical protein
VSGVTAVEVGDWVVITSLEGPHSLKRELHRVLGTDWDQDASGASRIARAQWSAARAVFWRLGVPVTLLAPDSETVSEPRGQPQLAEAGTREERVVGVDVKQRVVEDERAAVDEIASLQARIEELERKREELRLFLTMYEHYSVPGEPNAAETIYSNSQ